MSDKPKLTVVTVPVHDTGLGRAAGFASDAELIEAGAAQRAEMERLLTPEAVARLDVVERAAMARLIGLDES